PPGAPPAAPSPAAPPAAPPRAAAQQPRVGGGAAGQPPKHSPVDTVLVKRLLAQRPVPTDKFVIRVASPLKPETRYVVHVSQATNLIGRKGEGDVGFTTPKPTPPDTTRHAPRTPADTTKPPPRSKPPL